jgi:transglutaminase-like putative cysteine protease
VESSLNRAESLLDFSLIRTVKPIRDPGSTKHLKVLIEDAPPDAAIPSDMRQACERQGTGVICSVRADAGEGSGGREVSGQEAMAYLRPSYSIQSSSPEILSLARRIMGSTTGRERQIRLVMDWMGDNIAKEPVDSFSALDVLSQKKGECQGHAYLYAALARSMGIPTRVASGIVYSGELGGFMYHAWAESLVAGAWIAVDPTLSQMPADATHIKLVEGETLASLVPLAGFMGRIRIEILEVE